MSRTSRIAALGALVCSLTCFQAVQAQHAKIIIKEGDLFPDGPGQTVSSLFGPKAMGANDFYVHAQTLDGGVFAGRYWGRINGIEQTIRAQSTLGNLEQTYLAQRGYMRADLELAYPASCTDLTTGFTQLSSVWVDDSLIAIARDPAAGLPGYFYSILSSPLKSADNTVFWRASLSTSPGGSAALDAFFLDGVPQVVGGDTLPGMTVPLSDRFVNGLQVAEGPNVIAIVRLENGFREGVIRNGEGLVLDGEFVAEGESIPASVGGLAGETWSEFRHAGIDETGKYWLSASGLSSQGLQDIILYDGIVRYREGELYDEHEFILLDSFAENAAGDSVFKGASRDVRGDFGDSLFLNEDEVLRTGDPVDIDGDGEPDAGARIAAFSRGSYGAEFDLGDRSAGGLVNVYATAYIDTAGTDTINDDAFSLLELELPTQPFRLRARPPRVSSGDFLDVTLNNPDEPGQVFIFVTAIDGVPMLFNLWNGEFDSTGRIGLSFPVPDGFSGLQLALEAYWLPPAGRVQTSNSVHVWTD